MSKAPIGVALDAPSIEQAVALATAVGPLVETLKLGLEFFVAEGPAGVEKVMGHADCSLFLDLKLHDIPNTVAGAARAANRLAPRYLTVHALGGPAMISAAVEAAPEVAITAVTILTSMSQADLTTVGIQGSPLDAAVQLARLAVDAGARALVCSPQEVAAIRTEVGDSITLLTPGVRPTGADLGDQARVATPRSAIDAGADVLIMGRPITAASDPAQAVKDIAADLS